MPQCGDGERMYEIHVQGHIDPDWSDWFGGMTIEPQPGGESLLRGRLADQAALHGVLTKIRDMGLPLIQVTPDRSKD
jgi:hypothetical protein